MTTTDDRPATDAPPKLPLEPSDHILGSIAAVMDQVRGFPKSGEMRVGYGNNSRVQYNFQRWDDMVKALGDAFRTHGVATQTVVLEVDRYRFERTKDNGQIQLWIHTSARVRFVFTSLEDGSTFTVEAAGEALDNSDKGINKAITAAYKNACKVAFMLSAEDDSDPDASRPEPTGERVRNAPRNGQAPPTTQPPPEPVWQYVENAARQVMEQNPEPSRVAFAEQAKRSIALAKTTGDLAELAQWVLNKGAMQVTVDNVPLPHRFLSARSTLPVGPVSRQQQPAPQEPPPEHGGY